MAYAPSRLVPESVFDSEEAMTLHRLLQALATDEAEFDAAARLRGALAADLFGLDMTDLDRLREDDQIWAGWARPRPRMAAPLGPPAVSHRSCATCSSPTIRRARETCSPTRTVLAD